MPFRIPNFNLTCNIWHNTGTNPPVGPPSLANVPCTIVKDHSSYQFFSLGFVLFLQLMRLPARTDIRFRNNVNGPSTVECPAGTGQYYIVNDVHDVARGYANEYREASMTRTTTPTPIN